MGTTRTIGISRTWVRRLVAVAAAAAVGGGAVTVALAPVGAATGAGARKPTTSTTRPPTSTTTTRPPTTTSTTTTRPPTTTSTTSTTTVPTSTTTTTAGCASGTVTRGGTTYCVGYIFAVARTAYGVGAHIVMQGLWVSDVQASEVLVNGGPSCFPGEWCGQTVPSMTVTVPVGGPTPALGDVVDVYGVTVTGGLTTSAIDVVGSCGVYC